MAKKYSRARGKDERDSYKQKLFQEILPRTRERLPTAVIFLGFLGNTPAHAGKTKHHPSPLTYQRKYSRARGKDLAR